jgi:hypothetical protein
MSFFYIIEREDFLTHFRHVGTQKACLAHEKEYIKDNYNKEVEFTEIPLAVLIKEYTRSQVNRMVKGQLLAPTEYIINNF